MFAVGSRRTADTILLSLGHQHNLCLKKCGLDAEEGACSNHEEGLCEGACFGLESAESYNQKVAKALQKYHYERPDFIIVGDGRKPQERAVVCVENGQYLGFGF